MNYLALVNDARDECAASGTTLLSLGGALSKPNALFKKWVKDAWLDVQRRHVDWGFLEQTFSFITAPGQSSYSPATLSTPLPEFRRWKQRSLRAYTTSAGAADEQLLPETGLQQFRDLYQYGAMRDTRQRPVVHAFDPVHNLLLGPTPDTSYTVTGQYFRSPQILVADTDVPIIPEEFHKAITYQAMRKYGLYHAAPEVVARADTEGLPVMRSLEERFLPPWGLGPSLA